MKIAIIGAGFAGMAVTFYLSILGHKVTLFDPKEIGGGTSGIAGGLLHPYVGRNAKYNWMAHEGMAATKELLDFASKELGQSVILSSGLFRPALNEQQKKDFLLCAKENADVEWVESADYFKLPGIFIKSALTIDCGLYLKGLWHLCQRYGASHIQKKIDRLEDLNEYDRIIICAGAETTAFGVPMTLIKGQILTVSWPKDMLQPPMSMSAVKYLSPDQIRRCCYLGATYEKKFIDSSPSLDYAKRDIMPEITRFFPFLEEQEILNCRAGVRAYTSSKRPVVRELQKNIWIFTGLGSKGLLYHALLAQNLVFDKINNSEVNHIE